MADDITITEVLKPGVTWRGRDAAGTRVVLKILPDDCLRHGQVHPSIRLRLTRLREAPVAGLANLIGVAKTEVGVVTVSEYVRGRSLDRLTIAERQTHLPEARRLVEAMHRAGLVHGAVGPGNFVIERDGRLRLIDPSPFLYDDPAVDLSALHQMEPDAANDIEESSETVRHWPSFAAAVGLAVAAIVCAAGWVLHVAGQP